MNPLNDPRLRLAIKSGGRPGPEELADALLAAIRLAALQPGDLLPSAKDYAIANRLKRNWIVEAYEILKTRGIIQRVKQRRHVVLRTSDE